MQDGITFRAAHPSREEGLVYARYLDEVSEGFISLRLGRRAPDLVAAAFVEPDHDLSWENVTFVEIDGRIVGMASGFSSPKRRRFTEEPLRRAAGGLALRVRLTAVLFAPMLRILKNIPEGDWYIVTMILDDELRGMGVGSELLARFEDRAREVGARRLALDVADANEGARRLYERRGWTVESRWPALPLIPTVFHRMVKPLPRAVPEAG